jgi:hypothetical protein
MIEPLKRIDKIIGIIAIVLALALIATTVAFLAQ